jgi:predicted secreted protein
MAKPYVDLAALPRLLVRPRKTFEELRPHTGPLQGALVALVLIVVAGVVDALIRWLFGLLRSGDIHAMGLIGRFPTFVAVVIGFIGFLLVAGVSYRLVAGYGKARRPDAGLTVGLMGYAMFPVIILGIVISIVMTYYGGEVDAFLEETGGQLEDWGGWGQYWLVYWILLLVMLLWGVRFQAKAAVVANDSAGGRTLLLVLAAWVLSIVLWVVMVQLWFLLTEGELVDLPWLPFI